METFIAMSMVWLFSVGANLATCNNHKLHLGWYLLAVTGLLGTVVMTPYMILSDEMSLRREMVRSKARQKLLGAKMEEDRQVNLYLDTEMKA